MPWVDLGDEGWAPAEMSGKLDPWVGRSPTPKSEVASTRSDWPELRLSSEIP